MSDVAHAGARWNFLIVLATAGHSNPMFIWVGQKEDVAMLLHRLYSFPITLQKQLWMIVSLFLNLLMFPKVFWKDRLHFLAVFHRNELWW